MPVEYEALGGSLAALALSIIYPTLERFERTVTHVRFDQTVRQIAHLLLAARPRNRLSAMPRASRGAFPGRQTLAPCWSSATVWCIPIRVSEAVDAVSGPGVNAYVDGAVVTVVKAVSTPLLLAWRSWPWPRLCRR